MLPCFSCSNSTFVGQEVWRDDQVEIDVFEAVAEAAVVVAEVK